MRTGDFPGCAAKVPYGGIPGGMFIRSHCAVLREARNKPTGADLQAVLEARYAGCDLVRVMPPPKDGKLEPQALNDTDILELYVHANERHRQAVLVALLDNLGKGASGAAVQNIALMLGLERAIG